MTSFGPKYYWMEVDPETKNPTGEVCWVFYGFSDKPTEGYWILVKEVEPPVLKD